MNNIFSFTCYVAVILAILFILFSIPLSIFYKNDVYIPIGAILSISLFFNTINMIPNAILMKNKQFKMVGLRLIVASVVSSFITIILALMGFKYYAIAVNSVITATVIFLWNFKAVELKFYLKFNMGCLK